MASFWSYFSFVLLLWGLIILHVKLRAQLPMQISFRWFFVIHAIDFKAE
jgi:hypothetical protein